MAKAALEKRERSQRSRPGDGHALLPAVTFLSHPHPRLGQWGGPQQAR